MRQMNIRGRMEKVMEEEEAFWFLFNFFRDNPGQGLPILQYASPECDDLLIFPRGHGCIDGFYIMKDVGDKLLRDGVVVADSPDWGCGEEYRAQEALDNEEYLKERAK